MLDLIDAEISQLSCKIKGYRGFLGTYRQRRAVDRLIRGGPGAIRELCEVLRKDAKERYDVLSIDIRDCITARLLTLTRPEDIDALCAVWDQESCHSLYMILTKAKFIAREPIRLRVRTALLVGEPGRLDVTDEATLAAIASASGDTDEDIRANALTLLDSVQGEKAAAAIGTRWFETRDERLGALVAKRDTLPKDHNPARVLCALKSGRVAEAAAGGLDLVALLDAATADSDEATSRGAAQALARIARELAGGEGRVPRSAAEWQAVATGAITDGNPRTLRYVVLNAPPRVIWGFVTALRTHTPVPAMQQATAVRDLIELSSQPGGAFTLPVEALVKHPPIQVFESFSGVDQVEFTTDGRHLLIRSARTHDDPVRVIPLDARAEIFPIKHCNSHVTIFASIPCARRLLTKAVNGNLQIWAGPGKILCRTIPGSTRIYSLAVSPAGDRFALGLSDFEGRGGHLAVGEVNDLSQIASCTVDDYWHIDDIVFVGPNLLAVTCSTYVHAYAISSIYLNKLWSARVSGRDDIRLKCSCDGKVIVTDDRDYFRGWRIEDGHEAFPVGPRSGCSAMRDHKKGTPLWSLAPDRLASWAVPEPGGPQGTPISSGYRIVPMSEDGRLIAFITHKGIEILDVISGRQIQKIDTRRPLEGLPSKEKGHFPATRVVSAAFSPDGSILALGLEQGAISIWQSRLSRLADLPAIEWINGDLAYVEQWAGTPGLDPAEMASLKFLRQVYRLQTGK